MNLLSISTGQAGIGHMDTLKMSQFLKILSLGTPRGDKNLTLVPKNKKMSMTFKISNDVHTKLTNQKSFQTKRQHCCDPQCSSILASFFTIYQRTVTRTWFSCVGRGSLRAVTYR